MEEELVMHSGESIHDNGLGHRVSCVKHVYDRHYLKDAD